MVNKGKYFSIFLGLLYCIFIIWNRLIREKLPRDLFSNYSTLLLYLYTFIFIICLYICIYNVRIIFNITSTYRLLNRLLRIPIIEKFSNKIVFVWELYIISAPKNLYEYLYNYIYIRPLIETLCHFINTHAIKLKRIQIFIIIFRYSFLFLLAIIFIHDVFYLNRLIYFYKYICLLIIPILFDLFIFIIYNLSKKNKKIIEERIVMKPIYEENIVRYEIKLNLENTENVLLKIKDQKYLEECLIYNSNSLHNYFVACNIIDSYHELEKKIKPYIYFFIYSLYAIGWGYVLFNILF